MDPSNGQELSSPISIAASLGNMVMVDLLLLAGASVEGPPACTKPIVAAITDGKTEMVRYLISKGASLYAASGHHALAQCIYSAAMEPSRSEYVDIASLLLSADAAITDLSGPNGQRYHCVELLLRFLNQLGGAFYTWLKLLIDHGAAICNDQGEYFGEEYAFELEGQDDILALLQRPPRLPLAVQAVASLPNPAAPDATCAVCFDCLDQKEHCQLEGCSHTFCMDCVKQQWETVLANYNRCPLCRAEFTSVLVKTA